MSNDAMGISMMRALACSVACALSLTACSVFGVRSGTEQVSYTVVARLGDTTEVRRYPPQLVAETSVTASDQRSGRNQAFEILFDYISGANRSQEQVAMTAPVETGTVSEEIAMTAPVETTAGAEGSYSMRFFLPAEYTLETAPEPTHPDVKILEVPDRTLAVLRFSGWRDKDSVARRMDELSNVLAGSDWQPAGEPLAMFYDPPWTIPFLRRNEVAVPVTSD